MKKFKSLEPLILGIEELKRTTGEALTADQVLVLDECIDVLKEVGIEGRTKHCKERERIVLEVISKAIEIASLIPLFKDAGLI